MTTTGFLFIPEHIMERDDLSLQEKVVFGRVIGLTKKEGYCYMSNELLGKKLGMSGRAVSRYLAMLSKKKLLYLEIKKTKKGVGTPKEWGTRRKIYAFLPNSGSPYTKSVVPPSTKNGEYSITELEERERDSLSASQESSLRSLPKGQKSFDKDTEWKRYREALNKPGFTKQFLGYNHAEVWVTLKEVKNSADKCFAYQCKIQQAPADWSATLYLWIKNERFSDE